MSEHFVMVNPADDKPIPDQVLLPTFPHTLDRKVWFDAVEYIFERHRVVGEADRFLMVLQHLDGEDLPLIHDIITSAAENKYTLAKNRLVDDDEESENVVCPNVDDLRATLLVICIVLLCAILFWYFE